MRSFTIEKSGDFEHVPLGAYNCIFEGVEDFATPDGGDTLRWKFTVTIGEHQGKEIDALSDCKVSNKNKTGRFMSGLAGKQPVVGESFTPAEYIGKSYSVIVGNNKNGKPAINAFTPIQSA